MPSSARWRLVLVAAVRPSLTVVVLVTLYYQLPMSQPLTGSTFVLLAAGLVAVTGVVVWQIRAILHSTRPAAQGIQALAVIIPLFLLVFASAYYLMARDLPSSFNESLTRTDALYFTVTVFATVGFGDIVAQAEAARIVVTAQMIADLLVLGVVLQFILGAVRRGRQDRS